MSRLKFRNFLVVNRRPLVIMMRFWDGRNRWSGESDAFEFSYSSRRPICPPVIRKARQRIKGKPRL
jgi:hypothetical protein